MARSSRTIRARERGAALLTAKEAPGALLQMARRWSIAGVGAPLGIPMALGSMSSRGGWWPARSRWLRRPLFVLYRALHSPQTYGYAGSGGGESDSEGSSSGRACGASGAGRWRPHRGGGRRSSRRRRRPRPPGQGGGRRRAGPRRRCPVWRKAAPSHGAQRSIFGSEPLPAAAGSVAGPGAILPGSSGRQEPASGEGGPEAPWGTWTAEDWAPVFPEGMGVRADMGFLEVIYLLHVGVCIILNASLSSEGKGAARGAYEKERHTSILRRRGPACPGRLSSSFQRGVTRWSAGRAAPRAGACAGREDGWPLHSGRRDLPQRGRLWGQAQALARDAALRWRACCWRPRVTGLVRGWVCLRRPAVEGQPAVRPCREAWGTPACATQWELLHLVCSGVLGPGRRRARAIVEPRPTIARP